MIERYADSRIANIWSLETKFGLWQKVELAVIKAREELERIPEDTHKKISKIFEKHSDVEYIDEKEKELGHDLAAFLAERARLLPPNLALFLHTGGMTSYDTEEPAFASALKQSVHLIRNDIYDLMELLKGLALKHRYTPMLERTHGQGAEIQSFGRCCLAWHQDLKLAYEALADTSKGLKYSKLSGMIGSNSGIDPELERKALALLDFEPWIGSTQIMSRVLYTPVAGALANLASVVEKISYDIWLGARSGRPLWQEPFMKKQKGSSASPNKRNPIKCEQNMGMASMARHYAACIADTVVTAEGRDISQSCVERVVWPDLFHATIQVIKNLADVIGGLNVYPDNMMIEIIESRGTYAASQAKEVLAELGLPNGFSREDAYRIVQLASFNAFEPDFIATKLRSTPPESPEKSDEVLGRMIELGGRPFNSIPTIERIISRGVLSANSGLDFDRETVQGWNDTLRKIFAPENTDNLARWQEIFLPSHIIKREDYQFKEVFGF